MPLHEVARVIVAGAARGALDTALSAAPYPANMLGHGA